MELARLRRRAAQVVDRVAREEGPDVAAAVADAVGDINIGVQFTNARLGRYHRYAQQAPLEDETELTQFGESGSGFRNRLREGLGEAEMSLLLGRQTERAAALLITRDAQTPAAVRYTSAGALRNAGFEVVHSPTRGNPLHISVFPPPGPRGPVQWNDTLAATFDRCFTSSDKAL